MNKLILKTSLVLNVLLIGCCGYLFFKGGEEKQEATDETKIRTDRLFSSTVEEGDVVFMGDERVQICNWSNLFGSKKIKNLAVYQNTIENDMKRSQVIFENVQPSQIVMMMGLSDLKKGHPVNETYESFVRFVESLTDLLPQTELIVLPILPFDPQSRSECRSIKPEDVAAYNMLVKMYALEKGLSYVNLYDDFRTDERKLKGDLTAGDGFDLSMGAYVVWKDRLMPYLRLE